MLRALVLATLMLTSTLARAESGSSSISCSGHIDGQYFYAYTYQYVYYRGRSIEQEQHQFQFQGFLDGENFRIRNLSGPHVIYESANYFLAVPFQSAAALKFREKYNDDIRGPDERGRGSRGWQTLCRR